MGRSCHREQSVVLQSFCCLPPRRDRDDAQGARDAAWPGARAPSSACTSIVGTGENRSVAGRTGCAATFEERQPTAPASWNFCWSFICPIDVEPPAWRSKRTILRAASCVRIGSIETMRWRRHDIGGHCRILWLTLELPGLMKMMKQPHAAWRAFHKLRAITENERRSRRILGASRAHVRSPAACAQMPS
jgi:hypothetical protein